MSSRLPAAPNVCLTVPSAPRNVALVREMLTGLAETIALNGTLLNDILTAVTEACNNVALHAYPGQEGPLKVSVTVTPSAVTVLVRDHGVGVRPLDLVPAGNEFRIGLPVMRALAQRIELRDAAGRGTEVEMEFATPPIKSLGSVIDDPSRFPLRTRPGAANTAQISITPVSLARTILSRLLCVLASHADFSTDRLSDVQLIADALAAHAATSLSTSHLNLAVYVARRKLELNVGPLNAGGARRLIAESCLGGGLGDVIEKLTDRHCVADAGEYETLTLELSDSG